MFQVRHSQSLILLLFFLFSKNTFAQQALVTHAPNNNEQTACVSCPIAAPSTYLTRENNFYIRITQFVDQLSEMSLVITRLNPFKVQDLNDNTPLLNFEFKNEKSREVEAYKRSPHFGGWAKNKGKECYNTRAKVLIRDNIGTLKFKAENPCSVTEGLWLDPYAGDQFTDAQAIQIDHMVPLKEAYISGAYKWTFKERCLYGNYLGYNKHLIAVDGEQNNNKGDQNPINYMPPLKQYQCVYLKDWLTIKAIWGLSLTEDEKNFITETITKNECDKSIFVISKKQIQEQQKFFSDNINLCSKMEKMMIDNKQKYEQKKAQDKP